MVWCYLGRRRAYERGGKAAGQMKPSVYRPTQAPPASSSAASPPAMVVTRTAIFFTGIPPCVSPPPRPLPATGHIRSAEEQVNFVKSKPARGLAVSLSGRRVEVSPPVAAGQQPFACVTRTTSAPHRPGGILARDDLGLRAILARLRAITQE